MWSEFGHWSAAAGPGGRVCVHLGNSLQSCTHQLATLATEQPSDQTAEGTSQFSPQSKAESDNLIKLSERVR